MITSLTRSLVSSKQWYRSMLAGNEAFGQSDYEFIATGYGTGASSSIVFSSLSSSASQYKHLQIRAVTSNVSSLANTLVRFNGDTTSANYNGHFLYGDGTNVGASNFGNDWGIYVGNNPGTSTTPAVQIIDILDWQATKNKVVRAMHGLPSSNVVQMLSGVWLNTSVPTSVGLYTGSGQPFFSTTTRVSLYGIKG